MDWKRTLGLLLCTIIFTLLFIHFFGNIGISFSGLELSLGIKVAKKGSTAIFLPPLGVLKAYTHWLPIQLFVTLQNIDLDILKTIIDEMPDRDGLFLFFKSDILNALYMLTLKVVALALLGALFTGVLFRTDKKQLLVTFSTSLLLIAILFCSLYFSYDIDAFDKPEYLGTLKAAPWIIGLLDKGISQISELGQQLKSMSDNIATVFSKMDNLASTETESVIKVLHVSDIHNNPIAFDFMEQVIKNFGVDFVIDTGDLTDYGTPLEDVVIKNLSQLPIKYVFAAGNHDSLNTVEMLKDIENVIVLDGSMVNIQGINILGFMDPTAETQDIATPNELVLSDFNLDIYKKLWSIEELPDILAVHNPKGTENLGGKVPVVLNGHTHKLSLNQVKNSLIINAGTTGAAGIRGLQAKDDIPYSAVLLYFKEDVENESRPQLFAVDVIKIQNYRAGFQVERLFFQQESDPHE